MHGQPNIKTKTMFNGIVTNTGIIIRPTNVVSVSLRAHHSFPSLTIRLKQKTSLLCRALICMLISTALRLKFVISPYTVRGQGNGKCNTARYAQEYNPARPHSISCKVEDVRCWSVAKTNKSLKWQVVYVDWPSNNSNDCVNEHITTKEQ